MAQTFRFKDDTSYDYSDFAEAFEHIYGTSFVIPDGNDLDAASTGAGDASLTIAAGFAQCLGYLYENTAAKTITLSAQGGGNNRIDRIVLRRDTIAQTIRLTVIEGTPAVNPSIPALTANDMALYYVYVPDGFGAASTVQDYNIHDERVFCHPSIIHDTESIQNLIQNSEFMAFSDPTSGSGVPEMWRTNVATGSITATSILGSRAPRGQALSITLANNEWLEFATFPPYSNINDNSEVILTLKGSLQLSAGEVEISLQSEPGPTTHTYKRYKITGTTLDFLIRYKLDYDTYSSITAFKVHIENTAGAGNISFTLNPMILARSYIPGPYKQNHELLYLLNNLTDANWNSTAKATGTYQIDLDTDFSGIVLPGVRNVIGRLRAQDTNSAAGASPIGIEALSYYPNPTGSAGRIELIGLPNSSLQEELSIAGVSMNNNSFGIDVYASGTLTASYFIVGIVT